MRYKRKNPKLEHAGLLRRAGFTLIELLTVIMIIMLLVGILAPSISRLIKTSRSAITVGRISALVTGLTAYYGDNNSVFPGQDNWGDLGNSATGSQRLAYAMFTVKGGDWNDNDNDDFPKTAYVNYEDGFLDDDISNKDNTISDGARPAGAICYYPSQPGITGTGQYKYSHNSAYMDADADAAKFNTFITDKRFEADEPFEPFKPGMFLLIAPGPDEEYFTHDDIKNW